MTTSWFHPGSNSTMTRPDSETSGFDSTMAAPNTSKKLTNENPKSSRFRGFIKKGLSSVGAVKQTNDPTKPNWDTAPQYEADQIKAVQMGANLAEQRRQSQLEGSGPEIRPKVPEKPGWKGNEGERRDPNRLLEERKESSRTGTDPQSPVRGEIATPVHDQYKKSGQDWPQSDPYGNNYGGPSGAVTGLSSEPYQTIAAQTSESRIQSPRQTPAAGLPNQPSSSYFPGAEYGQPLQTANGPRPQPPSRGDLASPQRSTAVVPGKAPDYSGNDYSEGYSDESGSELSPTADQPLKFTSDLALRRTARSDITSGNELRKKRPLEGHRKNSDGEDDFHILYHKDLGNSSREGIGKIVSSEQQDERKDFDEKLHQMNTQLNDLTARNKELAARNKELAAQIHDGHELIRLRRDNKLLTDGNARLEDDKKIAFELAQDREKELEHDKQTLESKNKNLRKTVEKLQGNEAELAQYRDKTRGYPALVNENHALRNRIEALKKEFNACEQQRNSLEEKLSARRTRGQEENQILQATNASLEQNNTELKGKISGLEHEIHATHNQVVNARNSAGYWKEKHSVEVATQRSRADLAEKKYADFAKELKALEDNHKIRIGELMSAHDNQLSIRSGEIRGQYEQKLQESSTATQRAKEKYENRILELTEELSRLEQENGDSLQRQSKTYDSQLQHLQHQISQVRSDQASTLLRHKEEIEEKDRELEEKKAEIQETMRAEQEKFIETTRIAHERDLKKLRDQHTTDVAQQRRDIAAYSAALLERDNFNPMPDNDIKQRFIELTSMVAELARIPWREKQSVWTSDILMNFSPNQKLLRNHIIHDLIWCCLYRHIFRSPFHALGDEGRSLEERWLEACEKLVDIGPESSYDEELDTEITDFDEDELYPKEKAFPWPKACLESERWRYRNVTECYNALTKLTPTSMDGERARARAGLQTTLNDLREDIKKSISSVADLKDKDISAINKLSKKAATTWLIFGMQRCRIRVVLDERNLVSDAKKVARMKEDKLRLVVSPKLSRLGNAQGHDLDAPEETVGGCKGETYPKSG